MRLLMVHNSYQQPGGEDDVFAAECALLEAHGHEVVTYVRHNDEIQKYSLLGKASLALRTTWAWDSHAAIRELLARHRPELVHFQNTFPLISPAAYYACRDAGVAVVQTLHNARLMCPGGNYYRAGAICQECRGKQVPWRGALHGCYRGSRAASAVVATMLAVHNLAGTFREVVDAYIVPSQFYLGLFREAGLPADKLHVKPHFLPIDPGARQGEGEYALFIGRLAHQKGADTLLKAWRLLPEVPLKVRGSGEWLPAFQRAAAENPNIEVVPRLDGEAYFDLIRNARFLVWPSIGYYETFGRVAIEAFACGVPVLGSNIGASAELLRGGQAGRCFKADDPADIAATVRWAWQHPAEMRQMSAAARREYETKYTSERNYQLLLGIYEAMLEGEERRVGAGG